MKKIVSGLLFLLCIVCTARAAFPIKSTNTSSIAVTAAPKMHSYHPVLKRMVTRINMIHKHDYNKYGIRGAGVHIMYYGSWQLLTWSLSILAMNEHTKRALNRIYCVTFRIVSRTDGLRQLIDRIGNERERTMYGFMYALGAAAAWLGVVIWLSGNYNRL